MRPDRQRTFALTDELAQTLRDQAQREQRPPEDLIDELLVNGLSRRDMGDYMWECWLALSPREQEVAALACLGDTNRQIAARLGISPHTVKTHVRNILRKFDLYSKDELRSLLHEWDFSSWEE